jgi:hypothetical protein
MKNSWHINRRTMLKGIGASLSLPMLEIMGAESSLSGPLPPKRLISVFQPNGVYPKAWDVKGTGSDYEFSHILKPLESLRNELIILSNLDNVSSKGHVQMTGSFLTGVGITGNKNGISLDQMVAAKLGKDTLLPSLELGTEPPRQGNAGQPIAFANTVSWSSPTTRVSPEINPRVAFDRLFRRDAGPEARKKHIDRKSVLDLVVEDAKSLRRKASKTDRQKLDEYLEGVRSVETRIEKALNPPKRTWTPKTKPELIRPAAGIPRRRDEHLRLMMDLLVLSVGFSRQNFSFLEGVTSDHHGMSHHKNQPKAVEEYTNVSRWYIEQFAYMLNRLKSIDEGNGSILDNSIVLYGSGMKDGNGHRRQNLPILLAGHGQGTLKPGKHIVLKPGTPLAQLQWGDEEHHR